MIAAGSLDGSILQISPKALSTCALPVWPSMPKAAGHSLKLATSHGDSGQINTREAGCVG